MIFTLLLILSFIVGILTGMPTAKYVTPPSMSVLFALTSPWVLLYFFSGNPIVNNIRYFYLSWVIGICCYWTYFETLKKMKGGE